MQPFQFRDEILFHELLRIGKIETGSDHSSFVEGDEIGIGGGGRKGAVECDHKFVYIRWLLLPSWFLVYLSAHLEKIIV